jgi:hypothetical protein
MTDVINWCEPLGVGPDRATNVMYGMLYNRSLGTASILLRMGNISGRPCMKVMTYKALSFSASKQLGNYRRFYTIKPYKTYEIVY